MKVVSGNKCLNGNNFNGILDIKEKTRYICTTCARYIYSGLHFACNVLYHKEAIYLTDHSQVFYEKSTVPF